MLDSKISLSMDAASKHLQATMARKGEKFAIGREEAEHRVLKAFLCVVAVPDNSKLVVSKLNSTKQLEFFRRALKVTEGTVKKFLPTLHVSRALSSIVLPRDCCHCS
jgi:hypothetical protein